MRWEDERYVRLYTRDTPAWVRLGWEARALFHELLRKVDRAGILEFGDEPVVELAHLVGFPEDVTDRALFRLTTGRSAPVQLRGHQLLVRNFIEAQEVAISDKQRKSEQRARARDKAPVSTPEIEIPVTGGHGESHGVTASHSETRQAETRQAETNIPAAPADRDPPAPANPQPKRTRNAKPKLDIAQLDYPWPDEAGRAAMDEWVAHRQEQGKPMTQSSAQKLLNRYRGSPAAFVRDVDFSILRGWQGVFPPDASPHKPRAGGDRNNISAAEMKAVASRLFIDVESE